MYKTKVYFTDLKDNNHEYFPGDEYPREGFEVTEERLEELSSDKNRRGFPLIEKVADEATEEATEEVAEEPKKTKKKKD